jgi:hypothetical protein
VAARPTPAEPSKPYALDADKLERFLTYQHAATAASIEALRRIGSVGADSGTLTAFAAVGGSLSDQKERVDAARKASGLSEQDIHAISPMVNDLAAKFVVGSSFDTSSLIKTLEQQAEHAPAQSKAQMAHAIAEMKATQERQAKLTEERAKWGDANVDLLLSKKDELITQYKENLAVLGGGAQTAAPH